MVVRFLSSADAVVLKHQGYLAMDVHVHSYYSTDVPDVVELSPEMIVGKQRSSGLVPVMTDHDSIRGFLELESRGLSSRVICAAEMRIKPKKARLLAAGVELHTLDINVFGLTEEDFDALVQIISTEADLDMFVDYLRKRDLKWVYNHPFLAGKGETPRPETVEALMQHYFDVVELNATASPKVNDVVFDMAQRLGKGIVAGTDTHTGQIGEAFVLAKGNTFEEFWDNVKKSDSYIVRKDITSYSFMIESARLVRQIFRSTPKPDVKNHYTPMSRIRFVDRILDDAVYGKLNRRPLQKFFVKNAFLFMIYLLAPLIGRLFFINVQDSLVKNYIPRKH